MTLVTPPTPPNTALQRTRLRAPLSFETFGVRRIFIGLRVPLALIIAAQLTASGCNQLDPLNETLSIPVPQPHVPGDLRFRGDLVGFARSSTVYPRLSDRGKLSLLVVANAEVFAMDAIGYAGILPPRARAFRNLLKEALAADAFSELAQSANPPAQLYGLSGLYLVDRENYGKYAVRLRRGSARVRTFIGCIVGNDPVADVIGTGDPDRWEIAGGTWPKALAGIK